MAACHGLGDNFLTEVEAACSCLSELQAVGSRLDAEHRRLGLRRFPFGLTYRTTSAGVQIVVVAHRRRRWGYWQRRK
jgi:hypothetical protein